MLESTEGYQVYTSNKDSIGFYKAKSCMDCYYADAKVGSLESDISSASTNNSPSSSSPMVEQTLVVVEEKDFFSSERKQTQTPVKSSQRAT
jgi:hypothetical protein